MDAPLTRADLEAALAPLIERTALLERDANRAAIAAEVAGA